MKHFLCTDVTTNKKNKTKDGQEYACGSPNEAYSDEYEKVCNKLDKIQKDRGKKLMFWMPIYCLFASIGFGVFNYLSIDEGFSIGDMSHIESLAMIFIVAFVLIFVIEIIVLSRCDKYKKSKEYINLIEIKNNILDDIYADMKVPHDAVQVDIITFNYKVKNGKKIPKGNMLETECRFSHFLLWHDEEFLYLADHKQKYAFAKKYLSKISYKNEYISMVCEDRYFDSKKAKERGLTQSGGYYTSKPHFVLEYDDGIEKVEIHYTNFNSKSFEEISGLEAKENIEHLKSWRK